MQSTRTSLRMVPSENLTVSFFVTPSVCNKADPFQCTNGPKRCHSLQNHTLAFTSDYICAFLCTLRQPLQSGATSDPPFCPADTGLAAQLRLGWRMTHCSLISCKWLSSWVSGATLAPLNSTVVANKLLVPLPTCSYTY